MPKTIFHGRDAVFSENDALRLTVLREGGHLAEVFDKEAGISPLWVPPWQSIEPSSCVDVAHPEFGADCETKLLAGIMGHNLCLDLFGGPSSEEEAAGYTAHGEASVLAYEIAEVEGGLSMRLEMPLAAMVVTRSLRLFGRRIRVRETIENLTALDRPIGWTQHVTLGPPFLNPATTQFRASMTRSRVTDEDRSTKTTSPQLPRPSASSAPTKAPPARSFLGQDTHAPLRARLRHRPRGSRPPTPSRS